MSISLIAACDYNNAIGFQNKLLCTLPNDMNYFKKLTEHNYVLMGRNTLESIGKPLKNRINIVLTRNKKYQAPSGVFVYHSIEDVLNEYKNLNNDETELFVIGGSEVYNQVLPFCNKIYLTIIEHIFTDVDSYFPRFSLTQWKVVSSEKHEADEQNPYTHYFVVYEKRDKS